MIKRQKERWESRKRDKRERKRRERDERRNMIKKIRQRRWDAEGTGEEEIGMEWK